MVMETSPAPNPFPEFVAGMAVGTVRPVDATLRGTVPPGSFLDVMGIELFEIGPGAARAAMTVAAHHLNQAGACQGGMVVALADAAAGWAAKAAIPVDSRFVTVSMAANVIRAAGEGDRLVASAVPQHVGRSSMVIRVEVSRGEPTSAGDQGKLVAACTCTQMVLS